ncbi:nucleolin-like isoform X3 [Sorghum bicolor]|uniref:nucleolin-like isoform X3 n=1 Tax=Sorghum bicolor TaxID=4558 RepID=UPI000B426CBA|nr:nucleolin-like isoform X3 [Sorghum bicolor]|eukprot:XP_021302684.1 nucleolin-like isoform X3 [Sorghum bicolor]
MTTSAADDGSSLAPTVTEGETTAEAGAGAVVEECAESKETKVGAAAAVEEPDEEAREEDADAVVEEEEEEEEEKEEEDAGEVETADGIEAELVEPLPVLKPGEEDEPEELEGEKEELNEESEETEPEEPEEELDEPEEPEEELDEPEEPEEAEECKDGNGVAEVDGSVANETNEMSKLEYGKSGNTNKDEDADQLSSGSDSGNDMQNSELAGGLEIFVDNLPHDCVKEDIAMAFSQSGEVKSVRIIKNSSTGKINDVAFVCYASIEAAKKVLAEFKEGIEVKGKMVRVSACEDNNTIYLGNICKSWTRDQAKKVYLEHVPVSWDENKIKEYCEEYGEILKVDLFQILKNLEKETISFVEFSSSTGALACVAGINKSKIVDGSFKLCAYLAWPKSALKVNSATPSNAATTTEKDKNHTEKVVVDKNLPHKFQKGDKSKLTSRTKEAIMKTNSSSKLPNDNDTKLTSQGAAEVPQTSKSSEGKRKVRKNKHASQYQNPWKKAQNNCNVDDSQLTYRGAAVLQTSNTSKGKRKASENRSIYINEKPLKKAHNNILMHGYAGNLGGNSRSKSYASDLEPHAGFISPIIRDHGSDAYNLQRTAQYDIHPINIHPCDRASPAYSGYRSHAGYEAVFTYEYARNRAPTPPSGPSIPPRGRY